MTRLARLSLLALLLGTGAKAATVLVSDEAAGVIHRIDATTLKPLPPIHVGKRPRGLALSPDGRRLYIAVSDENRVAVIDVAAAREVASLPSGPDPETIALAPGGGRLYVANEDDSLLSVIDVAAGKLVAEVPVGGEPEGTAISPDGALIVQASEAASLAHVIDASSLKVIDNLLVDTRPRHIAFTPDGRQFWVSSEVRGSISLFDTASRRLMGRIALGGLAPDAPADRAVQAVGIVFTRDGRRAFVALGRAGLVAEIDAESRKVLRRFAVGWRAWQVALSADESRLFTANGLSGDVSSVDLATGTTTSIATGGRPWGVVVAP